jgi:hypothetical protein
VDQDVALVRARERHRRFGGHELVVAALASAKCKDGTRLTELGAIAVPRRVTGSAT